MTADAAWALTGHPGGPPLRPPAGVAERIRSLGAPLGVDPFPRLAERAVEAGFSRSGRVTCGGAGHLLRAADGWIAANLARREDLEAVAAWLEIDVVSPDVWPVVTGTVARRPATGLVERAGLLGLAVAALGEVDPPPDPVGATAVGDGPRLSRPPVVVDLSALWAGPLATQLLAAARAGPGCGSPDRRPATRSHRAA